MRDPAALTALTRELSRLPGIGGKSASKLAMHIASLPKQDAQRLSHAIAMASSQLSRCIRCGNISEGELCNVCQDPHRDHQLICVVEEPEHAMAIDRSNFNGAYHILGGNLSPMQGRSPESLNIRNLLPRARDAREIIIATSSSVEGEATANYLTNLLSPISNIVSRIGGGMPVGSSLMQTDEITIGKALRGRQVLSSPSAIHNNSQENNQ